MASAVDICNLALAHIGQDGVVTDIDPSDGTTEADYCAIFYPVARDELLEKHSWSFATFRTAPAALADASNELANQWAYAYPAPSTMVKPICVLPPESVNDKDAVEFEKEAQSDGTIIIYTDMEDAVLKFVKKVTDTTKFTPGFVVALSYKLAQYLAGPITKRPEVVAQMEKEFDKAYLLATAADASARNKGLLRNLNPAHLAARSV